MLKLVPSKTYDLGPDDQLDRFYTMVCGTHPIHAFLEHTKKIRPADLEHRPFLRFVMANELLTQMGEGFVQSLRMILRNRLSGACTINFQEPLASNEECLKLATAVSYLLGPANTDDASGLYYGICTPKSNTDSLSKGDDAYHPATLHTDGALNNSPIEWVVLSILNQNRPTLEPVPWQGYCLHLDDWQELSTYSRHPLAFSDFTYCAPSGTRPIHQSFSVKKPIFFESSSGLSISFTETLIHPHTIPEALYLHDLSATLQSSPNKKRPSLRATGSMLLLNNCFWLHGRGDLMIQSSHPYIHLRGSLSLDLPAKITQKK